MSVFHLASSFILIVNAVKQLSSTQRTLIQHTVIVHTLYADGSHVGTDSVSRANVVPFDVLMRRGVGTVYAP